MGDGPVVALRFAVALCLALAFGLPLLGVGRTAALRWSMIWLVALAAALSALSLLALVAAMAGTDVFPVDRTTLAMVVGETSIGTAFVVRFVALAVAFVSLLWPRPGPGLLRAATGIALATLAWTGHGAMDEGMRGRVHLIADIIHLLAAGAWIGAIAALLVAVMVTRRTGSDVTAVRTALGAFAATGTALVGSIVVSGAINGWLILGPDGFARVLTTDYGVLLMVKVAAFGAMVLLAAANRWLLTPMLRDRPSRTLPWVRASLTLELGCAVAILALVARLGMLSPQG